MDNNELNKGINTIEEPMSNVFKRREMRRMLERDASNISKFRMNDIILGGIVIIAMILSMTEFTLSLGNFKNFTALTLFLYIVTTIIYRNQYNKGKLRGRNDKEYCAALAEYREAKAMISRLGIASQVTEFCTEYKMKELREYRQGILAYVELDYDEYVKKYRTLSNREVMRLSLPKSMKLAIIKCNEAAPLSLTPGLILNENGEANRRRIVSQSGREREIKDKHRDVIWRGFIAVFGGMIAVNVIFNFSLITLAQWVIRMLPIFSALIKGADAGFCNIAVTETNFKKDQTAVINLFIESYNNKVREEKERVEREKAEKEKVERERSEFQALGIFDIAAPTPTNDK